jgi:mono/diheme cytochrome c family protein
MLAAHFPFLYATTRPWLVLAALMLLGAWARLFFNLRHAGRTHWWMPVAAGAAVVALAIAVEPDEDGAAGAGGDTTAGKAVFASAGCGACHVLADAGSSGRVGPNLDASRPSAELVAERVANGRGAMPAFRGRLTEAEIADVAAYVAATAGK